MNLGTLQSRLTPLTVAVLNVTLEHPADVVDTILTRVAQRKPHS
jgi:hypothetical protein